MSASFLISVLAGVTVATALALVAARLARRARAASRHALLAASLVVALALPLVAIVAPTIRVAVPVQSEIRDQVGPASFDVPDVQTRLHGEGSTTIVDAQPAPWRPSMTLIGIVGLDSRCAAVPRSDVDWTAADAVPPPRRARMSSGAGSGRVARGP